VRLLQTNVEVTDVQLKLGTHKHKQFNLSKTADLVCEKYGFEYCFFGFKKSDGLSRRLMLNTYEGSCINRTTKKVYPLANWKNKDVLAYIKTKKLLTPVKYGDLRSCDVNPKDGEYLSWCKNNYPNDLQKILKTFPLSGAYLFEYEQREIQTIGY
jgi:sulfate adenylyltransferase subunit 2